MTAASSGIGARNEIYAQETTRTRFTLLSALAACLLLWQRPAFANEKIELCNATPFKERLAQAATRHLIEQGANFKRFGVHAMPHEDLGGNYPPGTWIVYFSSSFRCGELGLDGGGWEVAIDPKSLKILKSFYSDL